MAAKTRSPWTTLAILLLVHAIAFAVFVEETWVTGAIASERASLRDLLGEELAQGVHTRAERWFTDAFVATGLMQRSFAIFVPTAEERAASTHAETLGEPMTTWFAGRLRVFWALVYQGFNRVASTTIWWPYALFVLLPFLVDGLVQRRIRQTNFDYASPVRHAAGGILILGAVYVFALLVFAPIPVSPLLVPVFLIGIALAINLAVANAAKRI